MRKSVFVLMCLIIGALFVSVSTRLSASSEPKAFAQDDVRLFRDKCGSCHGWKKPIDYFPGKSAEKRSAVIERMRTKKSGFISDAEAARIKKLLSGENLKAVGAAVESLDNEADKKASPPVAFAPEDVKLFRDKCGSCHGWKKPIEYFPGKSAEKRSAVIERMRTKKSGFISDAEAARIKKLLSGENLKAVGAAVESLEKKESEKKSEVEQDEDAPIAAAGVAGSGGAPKAMKISHGAAMSASFLLLGIYMTSTGLKRRYKTVSPKFKFDWKKHVFRGKLYALITLGGFAGGLLIYALDGFGAPGPHLIAGALVAGLYLIGGAAGLRLARGKAPANLKFLHFAATTSATVIFLFSIVSGVSIAVKL
jgi:cytochrome c553